MAFTITLRRQDCQRSRSKFVLTKQLICHSQDSINATQCLKKTLSMLTKILRQTLSVICPDEPGWNFTFSQDYQVGASYNLFLTGQDVREEVYYDEC